MVEYSYRVDNEADRPDTDLRRDALRETASEGDEQGLRSAFQLFSVKVALDYLNSKVCRRRRRIAFAVLGTAGRRASVVDSTPEERTEVMRVEHFPRRRNETLRDLRPSCERTECSAEDCLLKHVVVPSLSAPTW